MSATTTKTTNSLTELAAFGQSVWLDNIRRTLITSGELQKLIDDDGLGGMTSNPSIFEKAITGSTDYNDILDSPESHGLDAKSVYEKIAVRDIQDAADALRPVYEKSKRRDGYVSLEVSPLLAHDTNGTLEEARRLWKTVSRPNLMIKVPATAEGIPAFRQLISEGINVNVTLLFSQAVYEKIAEAYIEGLEARAAGGGDISGMASVASFFISRIDSLVDKMVGEKLKTAASDSEKELLHSVEGKIAIANAKLTYQAYERIFSGPRWEKLAAKGAQTQRLLWASTSTKNPKYRDVIYVEELIGADTVNTMPPATLTAYRDHGVGRASVTENVEAAAVTMKNLAKAGISMDQVTAELVDDGVKQFADAFDRLMTATAKRIGAGTPA
jgi:transaldolase/glucose-6-phosphate isomerase